MSQWDLSCLRFRVPFLWQVCGRGILCLSCFYLFNTQHNTGWISGLEGNKLGLLFLQLTRRQIKWGYCSFNIEQFQLGKLHLYSLMSEGLEKHSLSCFAVLTVSPQSKYKEHPTSKLLDWVLTDERIYLWFQKVFVCFVWSCVLLFPVGMYSLSNPIPEKERNSLNVWPHNNITLPSLFASSLPSSERMCDQKSSF